MQQPKFTPGQVIRAEVDGDVSTVVGFVRLAELINIEGPENEKVTEWRYVISDFDDFIYEHQITHHYLPTIQDWQEIKASKPA